jgi:hypothetical protein
MATVFQPDFNIETVDWRVRERIAALACLTGETPEYLLGGPRTYEDAKKMLVIPFPHRSYRMRLRTEEFAGISIREEDRFSHWYLSQIGQILIPYRLMGETIFSDK